VSANCSASAIINRSAFGIRLLAVPAKTQGVIITVISRIIGHEGHEDTKTRRRLARRLTTEDAEDAEGQA
jgi:hypothetical protein